MPAAREPSQKATGAAVETREPARSPGAAGRDTIGRALDTAGAGREFREGGSGGGERRSRFRAFVDRFLGLDNPDRWGGWVRNETDISAGLDTRPNENERSRGDGERRAGPDRAVERVDKLNGIERRFEGRGGSGPGGGGGAKAFEKVDRAFGDGPRGDHRGRGGGRGGRGRR